MCVIRDEYINYLQSVNQTGFMYVLVQRTPKYNTSNKLIYCSVGHITGVPREHDLDHLFGRSLNQM